MSGVGCNDLGIVCLMPTTSTLSFRQPDNCSGYTDEKASPGYYSLYLDKFNTKVEITSTCRTALSCYTFPEGQSNIILNLGLGLTPQPGGALRQISDTEVEGYKMIGNICGLKCIQTVYFVAKILM